MKQIYKMLLSIFTILMLASTVAILATENARANNSNSDVLSTAKNQHQHQVRYTYW